MSALLTYTVPAKRMPLGAFPHVAPAPLAYTPLRFPARAVRPIDPRVTWVCGYSAIHSDGRRLTGVTTFWSENGCPMTKVKARARQWVRAFLRDEHPGFAHIHVAVVKLEMEAAR